MYSKSDNIENMINDKASEVMKSFFVLLKNRYECNLKSMKSSTFIVFQMSWNIFESWWIIFRFSWLDKKNKKTAINSINKKDNKCFSFINIHSFINKYKREGSNFPSEKDGWKKIEKNKVTIGINSLYA